MKAIFMLFSTIVSLATLAQTAPPIQWQQHLGGSAPLIDYAYSIQQISDTGYIVAGIFNKIPAPIPSGDYGIGKLTKNGSIAWQKGLGGTNRDYANCIRQTADGGYIVAGASSSNNGDVSGHQGDSLHADCWIVKLNKNGDIAWQKSLGGSGGEDASSIEQTSDGGYIVAGGSSSNDGDVSSNHGGADSWIVKLTKNGGIAWQKSLGGSGDDGASSIRQTSDNGYIVAGYSDSNDGDLRGNHNHGGYDYWIVKLTKNGSIAWQRSLGGHNDDYANSIRQTSDGGYIVAGYSRSKGGNVSGNHGRYDYWIIKLKENGDMEWQKSLGGTGDDYASSIQQTSDGGYIVAGSSNSNDGDVNGNHGKSDSWIVKLKKNGNIVWEESLGGEWFEGASSIQQTSDNGYIFAGYSFFSDYPDYWIVKLRKEGSSLSGPVTNLYADNQNKSAAQARQRGFTVYPNPAKDILHLQAKASGVFSFINSHGEILFAKTISGNGSVNISTLPPGSYYVKNNATGEVQKLIVGR